MWYEAGVNASAADTSPISGVTAVCVGASGTAAELEVFRGQAGATNATTSSTGFTRVDVTYGSFLDSLQGMGGAGPSAVRCAGGGTQGGWFAGRQAGLHCRLPCCAAVLGGAAAGAAPLFADALLVTRARAPTRPPQANWTCPPDEVVTGVHVAWRAGPAGGAAQLATGLRVYCDQPTSCQGQGTAGAPSAAAPPAALPTPSPPQAPPLAGSPPAGLVGAGFAPNVTESEWFGPVQGPSTAGGICPCGSSLDQYAVWRAGGAADGPFAGVTGYCVRPGDGASVELFPTEAGLALANGTLTRGGSASVDGSAGPAYIARCVARGWAQAGRHAGAAAAAAAAAAQNSRHPLVPRPSKLAASAASAPPAPPPSPTPAQRASRLWALT